MDTQIKRQKQNINLGFQRLNYFFIFVFFIGLAKKPTKKTAVKLVAKLTTRPIVFFCRSFCWKRLGFG